MKKTTLPEHFGLINIPKCSLKAAVIVLRYYPFGELNVITVENRPNVLLSERGKFEYNRHERWNKPIG